MVRAVLSPGLVCLQGTLASSFKMSTFNPPKRLTAESVKGSRNRRRSFAPTRRASTCTFLSHPTNLCPTVKRVGRSPFCGDHHFNCKFCPVEGVSVIENVRESATATALSIATCFRPPVDLNYIRDQDTPSARIPRSTVRSAVAVTTPRRPDELCSYETRAVLLCRGLPIPRSQGRVIVPRRCVVTLLLSIEPHGWIAALVWSSRNSNWLGRFQNRALWPESRVSLGIAIYSREPWV